MLQHIYKYIHFNSTLSQLSCSTGTSLGYMQYQMQSTCQKTNQSWNTQQSTPQQLLLITTQC